MAVDSSNCASPDSVELAICAVRSFARANWLDLVRRDQCERWRDGHGVNVETYFELLPELSTDREEALVLICGEVHLRREWGHRVAVSEYAKRFPDLAGEIALQFDLDRLLVQPGAVAECETSEGDGSPFQLPGFAVLKELGRGGFGVVYLAKQLSVDRLVAIKVISTSTDVGKHLSRQRREAAILSRLQHAHIVQIYDVVEQDGKLCAILEYVDGASLAEFTGGRPLVPEEAAKLTCVLAETIHAVHEAGILHRDLKPSNILMTTTGEPKLTDFGLAKVLTSDSQLTTENCLLGTPSYMPPEQAAGNGHVTGRAGDVYSLGAILYELLTGRPPFLGVTVLDTPCLIRDRDPVRPRVSNPACPRDLETICLKCLGKNPQQRYSTAVALSADLQRYLSGAPILARRPRTNERLWKWCRRNPAIAALSAGLLLAFVVGFLGILWQWRQTESARLNESLARREAVDRAKEVQQSLERLQASLALVERGRIFSGWRRWDDAMDAFSKATSLYPGSSLVWEERGRLYAHLGLFDLAAIDWRKAFALNDPVSWAQCRSYATVLAYEGDMAAYRQQCAHMQDRFRGHRGKITLEIARACCVAPNAEFDARQFVERIENDGLKMVDDPTPQYVLGLAQLRSGRYDEAVQRCRQSLAADPNSAEGPLNYAVLSLSFAGEDDSENAQRYLALALESRRLWLAQLSGYDRRDWVRHRGALADWPIDPIAWLEFELLLGEARNALHCPFGATDPQLNVVRARAFSAIRRYEDADAAYQVAISLAPHEDRICMEQHRSRAYQHVRREEFAEAAHEFGEAKQLEPDDVVLWSAQAQAELAAGRIAAYEALCAAMLDQFGKTDDPMTADKIVWCSVARDNTVGDAKQLLRLADLATGLYPGALRTKGAALVRAGQYEEAIRCFQASSKDHAPHPCDFSLQAIAHSRMDHQESAAECLASAVAWANEADRTQMPGIELSKPAWGNWSWDEHLRSLWLLDEAKSLFVASQPPQ